MLAGLEGVMKGYDFGQKIMGQDPETRKARAAQDAAEIKAASDAMKREAGMQKALMQRDMDQQRLGETKRYHDNLQSNTEYQQWLQTRQGERDERRLNSQIPLTEEQIKDLQFKRRQREEDQAYRDEAVRNLGDFEALTGGRADPEQMQRAMRFLPMALQNAGGNAAKLRDIAGRAKGLMDKGDLAGADALWSAPEGQQALNDAWGPLFSRTVGYTDEDGMHRVTDAKAVGVQRSPDGAGLTFKIRTTWEPTDAFKAHVEQQIGAASSEEERNQLRAMLQPHTYDAPMTEGRVPVARGGAPKYLTPEDFQRGVTKLDEIARWQQENPDAVENLRTQLLGMASGENRAKGLERAQIELDKLYQRRAGDADRKLREEQFKLQKDKAAKGGGNNVENLIKGWRGYIGRQMPGPDEEDIGGARKRLADLQIRGEDIIRRSNGDISLQDAMRQAQAEMPVPHTDVVDSIMSGGGVPQAGGYTTGGGFGGEASYDGRTVTGPDGKKYVYKGGKVYDLQGNEYVGG